MDADRGLAGWLAGLTPEQLGVVLSHRPDALVEPYPATTSALAHRLSQASSVATAVAALPMPCLHLIEAALVLGGSPRLSALRDFLTSGPDPDRHAQRVGHWVDRLSESALAWVDADDIFHAVEALAEMFEEPLGLGPTLRSILLTQSVDRLVRILRALGEPAPHGPRAHVLERVVAILSDAVAVRALVASAPPEVAAELVAMAQETDDEETEPWTYDAGVAAGRRLAAVRWGSAVGLLYGSDWVYAAVMPAEITRALRGEEFRAPFAADPVVIAPHPVETATLNNYASAAISGFDDRVIGLIDGLQRRPVPALKSGGVGLRELTRLAKFHGAEEAELRLALELCVDAGLLARSDRGWQASQEAAAWRSAAPSRRMATLLQCWLRMDRLPTDDRNDDGKAAPALLRRWSPSCYVARLQLLGTLAELGPGQAADFEELRDSCLFNRPFAYPPQLDPSRVVAVLAAEASALGVTAAGALTELGRTLLTGPEEDLLHILEQALPTTTEQAVFGTDLTVVVTGSPAAALSQLFDLAADRESRGSATVWRFSPGSVRRAFDEGFTAARLQQRLAAVATAALPQPLRYLIDDVGRRHGNVQVGSASSVLCSEDPALLAEIVHHRALAKLGLVQYSDTVLGAAVDAPTLLAALRAAGYLPVLKGAASIPGGSSSA